LFYSDTYDIEKALNQTSVPKSYIPVFIFDFIQYPKVVIKLDKKIKKSNPEIQIRYLSNHGHKIINNLNDEAFKDNLYSGIFSFENEELNEKQRELKKQNTALENFIKQDNILKNCREETVVGSKNIKSIAKENIDKMLLELPKYRQEQNKDKLEEHRLKKKKIQTEITQDAQEILKIEEEVNDLLNGNGEIEALKLTKSEELVSTGLDETLLHLQQCYLFVDVHNKRVINLADFLISLENVVLNFLRTEDVQEINPYQKYIDKIVQNFEEEHNKYKF